MALVAVVLSACSSGETGASPDLTAAPTPAFTTTPDDGGIFYAYLRDPTAIDPLGAVEADELLVVDQLFDSLTAADEELRIVPAVAERWESNAEATRWVFHLRADARFHDGSPVDAAAFERAWERIVAGRGERASAAYFLLSTIAGFEEAGESGDLAGVRAVDPTTLEVRLSRPLADFPAVVSHPALAPVPTSVDDDASAQQPVGNGPFRMAEPWQPGSFIRLRAFEDHVDPPRIEEMRFRIYTGDDAVATAYADFIEGSLDLAPIPEGQLEEALERFGEATGPDAGSGVLNGIRLITAFYGFNTEQPPFDDPRIRRAISSLVDRETIVTEIAQDGRAVGDSVVPPGIAGYEPAACEFCAYDPARARELLGGIDVPPFELVYYDNAEHEAIAERVQRDVNATLGPGTMKLRALPQDQWLDAIREGTAGFFLSGWLAEYPAADSFLYPLFHASRIGSDNITRYGNQEVSELLAAARRTLDPARRSQLYRQAEAIVLRDMPVVPLFHYRHLRVVAARVEGLQMSAMGEIDMTEVRLDPEA